MKKKLYINACRLFSLLAIVTLFVACDAHRDFPDTAMKPCHILCTDGKVLSVSDFKQSEKQPIAVVFHVNHDEAIEGNGYAVYLWDLAPEAFADSVGVNQRTSADITALDGNENTFAIYDTRETTSPMAEAVFALWLEAVLPGENRFDDKRRRSVPHGHCLRCKITSKLRENEKEIIHKRLQAIQPVGYRHVIRGL